MILTHTLLVLTSHVLCGHCGSRVYMHSGQSDLQSDGTSLNVHMLVWGKEISTRFCSHWQVRMLCGP